MNKIYPQNIFGKHRSIKNYVNLGLLIFYFASSWIRWNRGDFGPNQALFIDLPKRRGYFFGIEIWPDEIYYIAAILILAAFGLFLFTSLFGRLWCGYTCPQTVFTELFVKIEAFFQGDRNARIKLDQEPWHKEKLLKKLLTHSTWIILSFTFAFGWVCYFYGAPELTSDFLEMRISNNGCIWLFSLTTSTYLFAAIFRDKVCTHICPYGRFQSAMLDPDTTVVTYHSWRGEPRHGLDDNRQGDCINCGKCVVVCPMGIDIRNGLQMSCIGCGLCIDACNTVMEKIHKPLYLIAYDSINSTYAKMHWLNFKQHIFRPKTIFYFSAMIVASAVLLYSLITKIPYKISVEKDRSALFTVTPDGMIRNTYVLKISNQTLENKKFALHLSCKQQTKFLIQTLMTEYGSDYTINVPQDSEIKIKIFIKTSKSKAQEETPIEFVIEEEKSKISTYAASILVS